MKKSALIFLMLSLFSFQSLSTADELVFYNWEDYISEDVIKQFEIETGHSIKILVFDRDNDRDELIARNGAQGIDLAVVDSIATQLFGKHKLLDSLENLYPAYRDHIGSQWQQRCGAFGLPYLWGTLGIVYRKDKESLIHFTRALAVYFKLLLCSRGKTLLTKTCFLFTKLAISFTQKRGSLLNMQFIHSRFDNIHLK